MSVAEYMSMQKQAYGRLAATREEAEQAVHPRYQDASRAAYATLAYILNDLAERTASFTLGNDVEGVRRQLLHLSPATKILDFGCGVGRLMEALAASGFTPDGVDISEEMLGHARTSEVLQAAGSAFFVSQGNDCGNAPVGHYDLAYSVLCFQHICVRTIRNAILASLSQCLKPTGVVCIQVQYFPGIKMSEIPSHHAGWSHDHTNASGTNSSNDVWLTSDMLPELISDFASHFSDLRLQFVDLPATFEDSSGRRAFYQHLFVSGSKGPGLHQRIYRN